MSTDKKDTNLKIRTIIGFDGNCPKSLKLHPDNKHIVYPFGIKLAAQNLETKEQFYFEGHSNVISAIALSKSGKYVASGQINFMGFKAPVIVWEWETRKIIIEHDSHKVRVESVVFSACENYIISLGGRDDANVIAFNIFTKDPVCGTFSSNRNSGDAVTLAPINLRGTCFMSGGVTTLKVWTLNPKLRSGKSVDVSMGKIKRKITCIEVDEDDRYAYCGTSTGDIMKIKLNFSENLDILEPTSIPALVGCFAKYGKKKKDGSFPYKPVLYSLGVRQIILLGNCKMLVGTGDGKIELLMECQPLPPPSNAKLSSPTLPLFYALKSTTVSNFITSLQRWGNKVLVGTMLCEILLLDLETFNLTMLVTCHTSTIFDIAFPRDYSSVFATASKDCIRMWSVSLARELLRISVPNFTCSSIIFTFDGSAVLSGWNDGNIRAFTPQSGKLIFTIKDAHNKGVTALAISKDGRKLLSGGQEGQIRVWRINKDSQLLDAALKEHKGPVSSIDISPNNREAASASTDGTCIIWDIVYHQAGVQILTCGTNRMVAYWEVFDGTLIREVEGSSSSALNSLDIAVDGIHFVTGANDHYLKVWKYKEGQMCNVGHGHGAVVTAVKISPDMKTIVSGSADGAVILWKSPFSEEKTEKKSERRASVRSLRDKIENIDKIDQKQSVGVMGQGGGDAKVQPPATPKSEGGSVKCYCEGECTCKPNEMPKTLVPPQTAGSANVEDENANVS